MTQAITRPIDRIPAPVGGMILSFLPKGVSYTLANKTFAAWNKKAMEKEWQEILKSPLLARYVVQINADAPLCFKILYDRLHKAFFTYADPHSRDFRNRVFSGSYAVECFNDAAMRAQRAEDENLSKAWHKKYGRGLCESFDFFARYDRPETSDEIRAFLNATANQDRLMRARMIDITNTGVYGIPQEVVKWRGATHLTAEDNNIRVFPEVVFQMENLQRLNLRDNPIEIFPEEAYDYFFSWENWLGRPFDEEENQRWLGGDWPFGFFTPISQNICSNGNIELSKKHLKEIPFAMWLRDRLRVSNLFAILGNQVNDWLPWLPCLIRWPVVIASLLIGAFIIAPPTWLLNQFLSLVVVPIATKVRELLGYGRMIKLKD